MTEFVSVPRETLDAVVEQLAGGGERDERLRVAGYQAGRAAATHGYETGWALGHDTGLSARQDSRSFVHGIIDGFSAGSRERRQVGEELLSRHRRPRRAEPELEVGQ